MKLNFKKLTSFFAVLLLAALLLSSCAPVVDNSGAAHLEVEKELYWKNIYQVGEDISLDGLTVKYYKDITESEDFETVTLTKSMISGFNTSKEGSFTMTVTYKGKTASVSYTVVSKAVPFEIITTFCISDNTVVSVDSASLKATVFVFDSYFKAIENQPTKTEEKTLSYIVNSKGKTCASFDYNGSKYNLFYDSQIGKYFMSTYSTGSAGTSGVTELLVHPISLDTLKAPQKNVLYKSELKEGSYYSIKLDDSYNAVVTKHTEDGDPAADTVMDSYAASDSVLTTNGLLRYSKKDNEHYSTATLTSQGLFKIRKEALDFSSSIYSALCSPSA